MAPAVIFSSPHHQICALLVAPTMCFAKSQASTCSRCGSIMVCCATPELKKPEMSIRPLAHTY